MIHQRNYYGACMVQFGKADALISGLTKDYVSTMKPALQIIGTEEGVNRVAGMYMMLTKKGPGIYRRCNGKRRPNGTGIGGYYRIDRPLGKTVQHKTAYCDAFLFKLRIKRRRLYL